MFHSVENAGPRRLEWPVISDEDLLARESADDQIYLMFNAVLTPHRNRLVKSKPLKFIKRDEM